MLRVTVKKVKDTKQFVRYEFNGGHEGGIVTVYYPKDKLPDPAPETLPVQVGDAD